MATQIFADALTESLVVWKVVGFELEKLDSSLHGDFATDSSYVVLNAPKNDDVGLRKVKNSIHFWIGKQSSVESASVAALKTIELANFLSSNDSHAAQYRETQGEESEAFVSCFPSGVQYVTTNGEDGQSVLRHARATHEPRLFRIKGKRYPRTSRVDFSTDSLNDGDAFVLDSVDKVTVWSGTVSNKFERLTAWQVACRIRDADRLGKVSVESLEPGDNEKFLQLFGSNGLIKSAYDGGDDAEHEASTKVDTVLYQVTGKSEAEEITVKEVSAGALRREMLRSDHCYIVEDSVFGVFVWLGKAFSASNSFEWTHILKRYAANTPLRIAKFTEGNEVLAFRLLFADWECKRSSIEGNNDILLEVRKLHQPRFVETTPLPDDGNADLVEETNLQVWRVESAGRKSPIARESLGIFYDGGSYIVYYRTAVGPLRFFIYFWQGIRCSTDEIMASALMAHKMNESECSGKAKEIRVSQNQEPEHFFKIFKNKITILSGGTSISFGAKKRSSTIEEPKNGSAVRLFQIFTTNQYNTKVLEVAPRSCALNTMDYFILTAPIGNFSWKGKCCQQSNVDRAASLKEYLQIETIVDLEEGDESTEFRAQLDGQLEYFSASQMGESSQKEAGCCCRFFQCFYKAHLVVEEVVDFTQLNLQEVEGSTCLLDAGHTVWVWFGKDANWHVRKATLNLAQEYIELDEGGRSLVNTPVFVVRQKYEPLGFTGHFHVWDYDLWNGGKTFEQFEREAVNSASLSDQKCVSLLKELDKYSRKYTYDELKGSVPDGVDPCAKEERLEEAEFESVFQMTRSEFHGLPKWKQVQLKKAKNLV